MIYIIIDEKLTCYAGQFYARHAKASLYLDDRLHCHNCGWSPKNMYFGILGTICCEANVVDSPQTSLSQWIDVGE